MTAIVRAFGVWLMIVATVLLSSGCAANQQFVHFPDQNKRIENPELARIYVMRPSGIARGVSMVVKDGRKTIGSTGPSSYLCWEREPGRATITGYADQPSSVDISVEKGSVYYVFQHLTIGMWSQGNRLEVVSEEEGRNTLEECDPPSVQ